MQQNVTFVRKDSLKSLLMIKNYQKVRDNYHFTGKYRGAAHIICNLKFNLPNEVYLINQTMIIILS